MTKNDTLRIKVCFENSAAITSALENVEKKAKTYTMCYTEINLVAMFARQKVCCANAVGAKYSFTRAIPQGKSHIATSIVLQRGNKGNWYLIEIKRKLFAGLKNGEERHCVIYRQGPIGKECFHGQALLL